MKSDSLFNISTLQKIQKARKLFLKIAVWILIAELVFGAILILAGTWDVAIGKIQGTFLVLALILFVGVNNFIRVEKGNRVMQIFASAGFMSGLVWGVLALLLMWEVVPYYWTEELMRTGYSGYSYSYTAYHMTVYAISMLLFAYAAVACFWISNVMSIRETAKTVKPLKITAIVCIAYLWIFGSIVTPLQPEFKDAEKLYQLAGLAGLAFWITACAALIISKTNGKKRENEISAVSYDTPAQFAVKTDAELRAEIEEKIRREMIEKEVRARMEAEQSANNIQTEGSKDEGGALGDDSGIADS